MEQQLKNYKTATWLLGLAVVVLAIVLLSTTRKEAASGIEEATMALEKCSNDLSAWIAENPVTAEATAEAKAELSNILTACSGDAGTEESMDDAGLTPQ